MECAVHTRLRHTNIVGAYEYAEDENFYTMIMENCNDASYFEDKIENVSRPQDSH